jgi:hypothetical protein
MPTVIDATVVNQAYDTSGNGGRKLVRLSNGWLVAGAISTNETTYFYVSKDNGNNWSQLCYIGNNWGAGGLSLVSKDNTVYVLTYATVGSGRALMLRRIDVETQTNSDIFNLRTSIDTQYDYSGASLVINEAGTELHAAWASKNSTYPNSFNIRYAKGTINADGSVTWGAVEQLTTYNTSGNEYRNPSIVVNHLGNPVILAEYIYSTGNGIRFLVFDGSSWNTQGGSSYVYNGVSYTQSSPSACVDKNGRIWVAWEGYDRTDTSTFNIRVAYSDDGGATWSTPTKLTSGNSYQQRYPTITCDKNNNVYVLWHGLDSAIATNVYNIRKRVYSSGSWGSTITVTNSTDTAKECMYPSALYDPTFSVDFSSPLFIYQRESTKVGFYGTWVVTTISVTPDYIGQKTSADKSNILSYSITTDGTMSDITETINGVTIATRTNPTSGQQFTVSLTQEQWDAIQYGNAHTLTIEMGSDTWTYTFDKRLNANDDILSAVKGVQDLKDHLNAVKAQLAEAIRAKGGTVNDTDAWSAFVSAVSNMANKRWASGSATPSSNILTVTGLSFNPRFIIALNSANQRIFGLYVAEYSTNYSISDDSISFVTTQKTFTPISNGFSLWVGISTEFKWWAFE